MFTHTSGKIPEELCEETPLPQSVVPLDQFLNMQSELEKLKEEYAELEDLRKQDSAKLHTQNVSINNLTESNSIAEERMTQALTEKEEI